jgi:hypothetical protein
MAVPFTFGSATAAIPLSQLDTNFATTITLGNTAIQLGNTVTTLNNMTLANVTISSGSTTLTNETVSGNLTLSGGTANGVAYLNTSKVVTTGSALVFDGTSLGVGIAAPYTKGEIVGGKLQVSTAGGLGFAGGGAINAYTGAGARLYFYDDSTVATIGSVKVGGSNALTFSAGGTTEFMRLDSSGNLGLGVTPSAWGSAYRSLDVRTNGAGFSASDDSALVSVNAYNNSGWKFKGTSIYRSSLYQQFDGSHSWSIGNTGTAGNAITFTQAMTLDADGNLMVGKTSTSSGSAFVKSIDVQGTLAGSFYASATDGGTVTGLFSGDAFADIVYIGSTTNHPLSFLTNNTERARIDTSGVFSTTASGGANVRKAPQSRGIRPRRPAGWPGRRDRAPRSRARPAGSPRRRPFAPSGLQCPGRP